MKKKIILTKKHNFLKFPQNSNITLRCTGLLKKKQVCEKLILKTMVKVGMFPLGQSRNLEGTHSPMHVLKKLEKGKI